MGLSDVTESTSKENTVGKWCGSEQGSMFFLDFFSPPKKTKSNLSNEMFNPNFWKNK